MTKKNIRNIVLLLLLGVVIGLVSSTLMHILKGQGLTSFISTCSTFLATYKIPIIIVLFIILYSPAIFFFLKGRKATLQYNALSDEEIDTLGNDHSKSEELGNKYVTIAMAFNSSLMALAFMIFGISIPLALKSEIDLIPYFLYTLLFLVIVISTSVFEIITVTFIQKNDPRLKGDPTTFSFQKNYLDSCDEAEQLKIYKSGYRSFLFSRNVSFVFIILSMLISFIFETGALAVIFSCFMLLSQQLSYYYYSLKK